MWLLACAAPESGAPITAVESPVSMSMRRVELILDQVDFEDGEAVSEVVSGRLLTPAVELAVGEGSLARGWAELPRGAGVARVERECGVSEVPYVVGEENTVVLPFPACARGDLRRPPVDARAAVWADVYAAAKLGLWPEIPSPQLGEEDLPARYVTLAEADAYCRWQGRRLPTAEAWTAATKAAVPELREWVADGRVAGAGELSVVPVNARSETIGFRCGE